MKFVWIQCLCETVFPHEMSSINRQKILLWGSWSWNKTHYYLLFYENLMSLALVFQFTTYKNHYFSENGMTMLLVRDGTGVDHLKEHSRILLRWFILLVNLTHLEQLHHHKKRFPDPEPLGKIKYRPDLLSITRLAWSNRRASKNFFLEIFYIKKQYFFICKSLFK